MGLDFRRFASIADEHGEGVDTEAEPADENDVQEDEPEQEAAPQNPPACIYCGGTDFGGEPEDNGRIMRAECQDCDGTMVSHDGIGWNADSIGSPHNHPKGDADPASGGVGGTGNIPQRTTTEQLRTAMPSRNHPAPDGISFGHREFEPDTDEHADLDAANPGWHHYRLTAHLPEERAVGYVDYSAHPHPSPGAPGLEVNTMGVRGDYQRRGVASAMQDHLRELHPEHVINHGGRSPQGADWWGQYDDPAPHLNWDHHQNNPWKVGGMDPELRLHFTATWADVRAKAIRIRAEGGVMIKVASADGVGGEVRGDHGTYETVLSYLPGSRKVGSWHCFLPDAPVMMADGSERRIDEIQPGDEVITHTGAVRRVVRAEPKPYSGELVRVKPQGDFRELVATSEHRVYAANRDAYLSGRSRDVLYEHTGTTTPVLSPRSGWQPIGELTPGGYLSRSVLCDESPLVVSVPRPPLRPVTSASGVRGVSLFRNAQTEQQYWIFRTKEGGRAGRAQTQYFKTRDEAVRASDEYYAQRAYLSVKVDDDLAYWLGWYAAEGFLVKDRYQVGFSLSSNEQWVVDQLDEIAWRKFGVRGHARHIDNKLDYRISHFALHHLAGHLVGYGAKDKSLSAQVLNLPGGERKRFLDGWLLGDGCVEITDRHGISTANETLALQARELLAREGFTVSINRQKTNPGGLETTKRGGPIYQVRWQTAKDKVNQYRSGGMVWQRIESVSREPFIGEVWDIEVEGDHSFRAYGYNVHNCDCAWGTYAWDRAPAYQRFQGRLCSHGLAMQIEAQSHDRPVSERHPQWMRQHRTRHTVESALVEEVYPDGHGLDLRHPPIYAFVLDALAQGADPAQAMSVMLTAGIEHAASKALLREAMADPLTVTADAALSWHDIQARHPQTYGGADGDEIGSAANYFAHSRPEDPEGQSHSVHDLRFTEQHVDPHEIDHEDHGRWDPRVWKARRGYQSDPDSVPPLLLIRRHDTYVPADGHHRAQAGRAEGVHVRAYVAHSPYDHEPMIDANGPVHAPLCHREAAKAAPDDAPTHAGLVLKAGDTGRILMLQRSLEDEKDPARGTWEFPGGGIEEGDHNSLHGAFREFSEEVGQPVPKGGTLQHVWRSGPYVGHVMVVPNESGLTLHDGRVVPNPDDPKGDHPEQAAWWDPAHAQKNPALREECKSSPWKQIKEAARGTTAIYSTTDPLGAPLEDPPGLGTPPQQVDSENPASTGFATGADPAAFNDATQRSMSVPDMASYAQLVYSSGEPAAPEAPMGHEETFWRVHPADRPFGPEHAHSRDWGMGHWSDSHDKHTDHGFSSFHNPHHLYAYFAPDEDSSEKGYETLQDETAHVVHFKGRQVGTGEDNEPLVMPSSNAHQRMSWADFKHHVVGGDRAEHIRRSNGLGPSDYLRHEASFLGTLHNEPEGALPSTDGAEDDALWDDPGSQVRSEMSGGVDEDESVNPTTVHGAALAAGGSVGDIVARFQVTAGAQALGTAQGPSDGDIASAARAHLSKAAVKTFTPSEQQELITEGVREKVRARNLSGLDIDGTHYAALEEALAQRGGLEDGDTVVWI